MFGETAMLKLFRRLELGRNLDIEVHDALNRAGVDDVAGLFGWVEGSWTVDGERPLRADLAMVVEKLADAEDGWGLALDSLRRGRASPTRPQALGVGPGRDPCRPPRSAFPTADAAGDEAAAVMRSGSTGRPPAPPALQPLRAPG